LVPVRWQTPVRLKVVLISRIRKQELLGEYEKTLNRDKLVFGKKYFIRLLCIDVV
jgi:hypothetical protein